MKKLFILLLVSLFFANLSYSQWSTNTNGTYYAGSVGIGKTPSTNSAYKLNMGGNINMNGKNINYLHQLHFNNSLKFYESGNNSYLNFQYGKTGAGGIRVYDGSTHLQGVLYANGFQQFGLLDGDKNWSFRIVKDQYTTFSINNSEKMRITTSGNVGIGTNNPKAKLEVSGNAIINGQITVKKIWAKEDIVISTTAPNWSDFVFEHGYKLPTLQQVEAYIIKNKHLIDIPAALEIEENGIPIGKMNALLLQKIEELTLYTIEQQRSIEAQQQQIDQLIKLLQEQE